MLSPSPITTDFELRVEKKSFKCPAKFSRDKLIDDLDKFNLSQNSNIDNFLKAMKETTDNFTVEKVLKHNNRIFYNEELHKLKHDKSQVYK